MVWVPLITHVVFSTYTSLLTGRLHAIIITVMTFLQSIIVTVIHLLSVSEDDEVTSGHETDDIKSKIT